MTTMTITDIVNNMAAMMIETFKIMKGIGPIRFRQPTTFAIVLIAANPARFKEDSAPFAASLSKFKTVVPHAARIFRPGVSSVPTAANRLNRRMLIHSINLEVKEWKPGNRRPH